MMPKPCLKLSCGTNFQGMTMWHDLQMTPGLRHSGLWITGWICLKGQGGNIYILAVILKKENVCAHVSMWVPIPVTCLCGGQRFIIECPSASFKDLFIFVCKFECLYACTHTITCMSGAYRDKKRASDHLELPLQVVESCLFVGNENSIQVLRKSTKYS